MDEKGNAVSRPGLFSKAAGLVRKAAEAGIGAERARKALQGVGRSNGSPSPALVEGERKRRDLEIRNQELNLLRELQAAKAGSETSGNSAGSDARAGSPVTAGVNGAMGGVGAPNGIGHPLPINGVHAAAAGTRTPRRFVSGDSGAQPWEAADVAGVEAEFPPTLVMEFGASQMLAAHLAEMGLPAGSPILGDSWAAVVTLAPEVEDAAMRFANGDVVGAEEKLREALEGDGETGNDVMTDLALFDLYRATDQAEKFAAEATAFSHRTGLPAPNWMAIGDAGPAQVMPLPEGSGGITGQILRLHLHGELMGDVAEVVTSAVEPGQAKVIELNCRALRRVDFGAGTTLIRWVANQHHQGRRVGFVEVNWMVAAFLDLLGFGDTARVIRRTD